MLNPRISVIMPVYNGVRFVAHALASVLSQDLQDWELIVVNDGSTDGTAEVLTGYTDDRIRVIHQANRGEAAARNRGLDAANGEFVAFLDADDLYLPDALHAMADYLDTHPQVDAVFSDGYFCDEDDRRLGRLSDVRPGPFTGNILEPLILNSAVITVPVCTMTRRTVMEGSCVRFDPALVIGPDWDFWIHLARVARFDYLDRLTCMYRVHQTNITLTSGSKRRKADLVLGRLKVLHSSWFGELSDPTRGKLLYQLLVDLLDNSVDQQRGIIATPAFLGVGVNQRADLLRVMASQYLLQGCELGFAFECLREAVRLHPSRKNWFLLRLARASVPATVAVLRSRNLIEKARWRIRRLRGQVPKSAPPGLVPLDR